MKGRRDVLNIHTDSMTMGQEEASPRQQEEKREGEMRGGEGKEETIKEGRGKEETRRQVGKGGGEKGRQNSERRGVALATTREGRVGGRAEKG